MKLAFRTWSPAANSTEPIGNDQTLQRLVLLHGMGGTGTLWRPIAATLETEFAILAVDQRGHGGSRHVPASGSREAATYTPLDYGRDVIETMEQESFHPAWLVGHSMGVRTACAAAHLKPEWVRGLVLVDLGFSGPAGGGLGQGLATFLRKLPLHFASREEARQFMSEQCPDPSIAQYLMAVSVRAADGTIGFPFEHSALIQTIEATAQISVRPWIRAQGERGMPILVLRGAESLVWSREDFEGERKYFADVPSIQFMEIEGAGHGLPFEQRMRFCEVVRGFVAKSVAGPC